MTGSRVLQFQNECFGVGADTTAEAGEPVAPVVNGTPLLARAVCAASRLKRKSLAPIWHSDFARWKSCECRERCPDGQKKATVRMIYRGSPSSNARDEKKLNRN